MSNNVSKLLLVEDFACATGFHGYSCKVYCCLLNPQNLAFIVGFISENYFSLDLLYIVDAFETMINTANACAGIIVTLQ